MAPRFTIYIAVALFALGLCGQVAAQGSPRISARDQLTITIFGVEALSGKFPVASDGTITYPHLGTIRVAGLGTRELEADLAKKLKDAGFLLNPQVTVELVQTQTKRVIVTGAVRTPGPLPFAGSLTLFEALALVGSTTSDAGDIVLVTRADANASASEASGNDDAGTGRGVIEVSLSDLERGRMEHNVALQDGDQIFVPRAQQVFISGQVRSPNGYTVPAGTTVLQAITLAGGLTDRGTMRGIKILRNNKEVKNVKPSTIVMPGDTLIVKASPF